MYWKKIVLVVAVFGCVVCWKPIFGKVIQGLLAYHNWHLSYETLEWKNGEFVFSHIEVKDPQAFILRAREAHLSLKNKSIQIHEPLLKMLAWTFQDAWPDWKLSMSRGLIETEEFGRAEFVLERAHKDQIIDVVFEREGEYLHLEALRVDGGTKLCLDWKGLELRSVNRWWEVGQFLGGKSEGSGAIVFQEGERGRFRGWLGVEGAQFAFGCWEVNGFEGKLEWEGPLQLSPEVRLRGELRGANCLVGEKRIRIDQGEVSAFPGVGMKLKMESESLWALVLRMGLEKEAWIDGELLFQEGGRCNWRGNAWEMEALQAKDLALLQSVCAPFFPELGSCRLMQGVVSGWGEGFECTALQGERLDLALGEWKIAADRLTMDETGMNLSGLFFETPFFKGEGSWERGLFRGRIGEWEASAEARFEGGSLWIEEGNLGDVHHLSLELTAQAGEVHCYRLRGEAFGLPFHVPHFALKGEDAAFDVRIEKEHWDAVRLWGTSIGGEISFDLEKSHLFGEPFVIDQCKIGKQGLEKCHFQGKIPLDQMGEWLDRKELVTVEIHYEKEGKSELRLVSERGFLEAEVEQGIWNVKKAYLDGVNIEGRFVQTDEGVKIEKALGKWGEFEVRCEGSGMWQGGQIILDLSASDIRGKGIVLENRGSLHVEYSSKSGVVVQGLNLESPEGAKSSCRAGLLQYHAEKNLWTLTHSHVQLPGELFTSFGFKFPVPSIDLMADFEWGDSSFICRVREGSIPFQGMTYHIRNLKLASDGKQTFADFQWVHGERLFPVYCDMKEERGFLVLHDEEQARPLSVEWEWTNEGQIEVASIEGCFAGLTTSFYREVGGDLMGSARFDFSLLEEFMPSNLLSYQLGAGYELKGRLSLRNQSFQGILSGKEIELLGLKFRTLQAQVECSFDKIHLFGLILSDSAGVLQIPELTLAHVGAAPWVLDIPHLLIQELRPSLLQKIGESPGPMTPLLVREFHVRDFHGLLSDPTSYTAQGELIFLNSYRRMHTVFDLPSDVIGLLVGLDQELLIPTCGTLRYELKNGRILFTELVDAFSQGKRSQFFLVKTDDSPSMDLTGELHILIKMKQFVLFKFTEFFLISIDGTLTDPSFHLQKKKGFFGL